MIGKNVKKYCKEDITKIENYDLAKNDEIYIWQCHHRLELTPDGDFAHTPEELKEMGLYFDRPCNELIFLSPREHTIIHKRALKNVRKK